jgi:3-hydroxyacyl-CoA dehydrogenase
MTRVAVIGAGVIGASWATLFLANGLDVAAADPAPGAEANLRALIARQWPAAEALGLAPSASQARLSFAASPEDAVANADFVQESGPERLDIKRVLYRKLDEAARPETVIASSSSGLLISDIQAVCAHPERILLGHPFNPPHLIPLVEVVGGRQTAPWAIDVAMDFYRKVGKRPILLKKEVKGHIANRLQAALWREAFSLVREGVASVEDIDAAIAHGPGLRWALLGPFLNLHLSGGAGGLRYALDHLGEPIESWWRDLGHVTIDTELKAELVAGADDELAGRPIEAIVEERDKVLLALLRLKSETDSLG